MFLKRVSVHYCVEGYFHLVPSRTSSIPIHFCILYLFRPIFKFFSHMNISLEFFFLNVSCFALFSRSRDNVVGIMTRLKPGHPMNSDLIPGRSERFVSSPKRPGSPYSHPASYSISNGGSFSGVKAVWA